MRTRASSWSSAGDRRFATVQASTTKYEVRFAPGTTPTAEKQITLARQADRKLGVPNAESAPRYRVGRNSHTGESWAYVEWTWERLR
jgi:hypothetical protein